MISYFKLTHDQTASERQDAIEGADEKKLAKDRFSREKRTTFHECRRSGRVTADVHRR